MHWEANFSSFMVIRGIMNKMAEGDEYLDYSLECEMKLWRQFFRGVAHSN